MSRYQFGGQLSHYGINLVTVDSTDDLLQGQGGDQVQLYNAETGGSEYIDLSEDTGGASPIETLLTSTGGDGRTLGQIPPFYGPDGVRQMWASIAGGPRGLMVASDIDQLGDDVVLTGRLRAATGIGAFGVTPPTSRPVVAGARDQADFVAHVLEVLENAGFIWDMSSAVVNQAPNGDLHDDLDGWGSDNSILVISSTEVHGPASIQITSQSAGDYAARYGEVVDVVGGDEIQVTAWVMTTISRTVKIQIDWSTAAFAYISTDFSTGDVVPASTPTKISFTATAPPTTGRVVTSPRVMAAAGAGEVAYIADLQVIEI